MKKILTLTLAITIALAGMAQGKSNGKGQGKKDNKYEKHADKKGTHDDRDGRYDREDRNDHDRNDHDGVNQNGQNNNDKYSKNLPSKVRSAFNNDFPNARNVTWTKNSGYWTASFPNGIYRRTVTYAANGQRVNNGSTSRRYTNSQDGSIWDKILTKQ